MKQLTDIISIADAKHLPGLFCQRVHRTPDNIAFRQFDENSQRWSAASWQQMDNTIDQWHTTLANEKLTAGDRVAIMLRNCREWVYFDQAAMRLGLVTVPLYPNDHAENAAYILENSGARLLLIESGAAHTDLIEKPIVKKLERLIVLDTVLPEGLSNAVTVNDWLDTAKGHDPPPKESIDPHSLASIVYTSGTTGPPKGVMLSHHNMLWNAWSGLQSLPIYPEDHFLSFLPLSHTLERSVGYYLPVMAGSTVSYARSIPQLADDLATQKPTVLISVPRIYERIYNKLQDQLNDKPSFVQKLFQTAVDVGWQQFEYQQKRTAWHPSLLLHPLLNKLIASKVQQRLGGHLRVAICGGAPLSEHIAKTFIGLGIPIFQGYGLTETSPVVSVNTHEHNLPRSIGLPLQDVEVAFSEQNELLIKSPGVMLGYWDNEQATADSIDNQGWLHSGDLAEQDDQGYIHITGRLKDIIVLATGEKIPPADMESVLTMSPYIEHALIIGEGKPFLTALVVLTDKAWPYFIQRCHLMEKNPDKLINNSIFKDQVRRYVQDQLRRFPVYAEITAIAIAREPWTVENDLATPTLKIKRDQVLTRYQQQINALYEGH